MDDNKSGGGYAYRASKSALNIVNKSMSIDLAADGISSVLLHPGAPMPSAAFQAGCVPACLRLTDCQLPLASGVRRKL